MSIIKETKRKTTQTIRNMKVKGEKISVLTAYDFTMASILDEAGIDVILVGDSAANVMAGHETTVPITLDQMIYHASCVTRGCKQALVVVDLPFGTYQGDPYDAYKNAVRVMKETGAHAVKLEGGKEIEKAIQLITQAGIPVMGHLGLTPQSIHQLGSFGIQAKGDSESQKLKEDALLLESLGCFSVVLEKIPSPLAKEVSEALKIPTIGIGGGSHCDGQVLVINDMLGMTKDFKPKFLRQYLNLYDQILQASSLYIEDVKRGDFPNESEQY